MHLQISWWTLPGRGSLLWLNSHRSMVGKDWLLSFSTSKTKLVSFHHHKADPKPVPILMSDHTLKEAPCFEHLLSLNLTLDLKWNTCIHAIAKDTGRMVWYLYCIWKYLIPAAMLKLYKSQIRPRMEFWCHIWTGAVQSSLSSLDKVQKWLSGLVSDELSYR